MADISDGLETLRSVIGLREIASLIRGADLRIFERSSHSIRADEPEAMVDAILGFLVYRAMPARGLSSA